MRQVWVKVPTGKGEEITRLAKKYEASNLFRFRAQDQDKEVEVIEWSIPNHSVNSVLQDLCDQKDVEVTLLPHDVFPMEPSTSNIPQEIMHVTQRSPVEVWLNGLQSIGSWKGFLGYAAAASILVWIGMYTNTIFLLVGAMLVAPFAGPAMNTALATAAGDTALLWRSLLRYFASIGLTIVVAWFISLVLQEKIPTATMVSTSEISAVAVLLPLVAGAVGAHSLSQARNNSLVPGAVTGMLIAASLAPPAGLVGMALAIGRFDMALSGLLLLLMQLFGINLTGGLVFRYYHLGPNSTHFQRGKAYLFYVSLGASLILLGGVLAWQFWSIPDFQRASRTQQANSVVSQVLQTYPDAKLVQANMSFPRPSSDRQNILLGVIYVQQNPQSALSKEKISQDLTRLIGQQILSSNFNVTPLITVTVLQPPGSP